MFDEERYEVARYAMLKVGGVGKGWGEGGVEWVKGRVKTHACRCVM